MLHLTWRSENLIKLICWFLVFIGSLIVTSSLQIASGLTLALLGFLNLVNFFQKT